MPICRYALDELLFLLKSNRSTQSTDTAAQLAQAEQLSVHLAFGPAVDQLCLVLTPDMIISEIKSIVQFGAVNWNSVIIVLQGLLKSVHIQGCPSAVLEITTMVKSLQDQTYKSHIAQPDP